MHKLPSLGFNMTELFFIIFKRKKIIKRRKQPERAWQREQNISLPSPPCLLLGFISTPTLPSPAELAEHTLLALFWVVFLQAASPQAPGHAAAGNREHVAGSDRHSEAQ